MQNNDTPTQFEGNSTIRSYIFLKQNEQVDENLLCNVCSELVIEPVECEDCQNLFCTQCINDWRKKSQICPFKCASNPMKIKPPHRLVKIALSSINYTCVNKTKGCNEIMNQDQFAIHQKECKYVNIKCDNEGCSFTSLKCEMLDHKIQCQYTTVSCEKCNLSFYRRNQKDHDCLISLIKRVNQLESSQKNQDELMHQLIKKTQIIDVLELKVQELSDKLRLEFSQQIDRKCPKNHSLTWIKAEARPCNQCQQIKTIRWICKICQLCYCIDCRGPSLFKGQCPSQHKLIFQQQCISNSLFCDICKTKPKQTNSPYWSDRECDFDICQQCLRNQ